MLNLWINNFRAGLRLILGLPVARQHFGVSLPFLVVAFVGSLALFAGLDYLQLDHVRFQDIRGTALLGTFIAVGLLLAVISAHLENDYPQLPVLLTVALSALPWMALLVSLFPYDWAQSHSAGWLLVLLLVYAAFIAVRCLRIAFYRPGRLTQAAVVVAMLCVAVFSWRGYYFPSVFDAYNPDEYSQEPAVDVEHTFYQQQRLVEERLESVQPSSPDQSDFFFLGFGGSDRQTVFESETLYASQLIDSLYGTGERSVVLYNNVDKLDRQPIANTYNLSRAIEGLGALMDIDQDVLIVLLTSHGDDDATLAVELESLNMKVVSAGSLKVALDDAHIKWRIIIISACYSGSFIDALEDENTLIITAASAERNSFGCSSERELTVFGEAFFKNALRADSNWVSAFEEARELISSWEAEADLPRSNPQIRLGSEIQRKLGLPPLDIETAEHDSP